MNMLAGTDDGLSNLRKDAWRNTGKLSDQMGCSWNTRRRGGGCNGGPRARATSGSARSGCSDGRDKTKPQD
eukprot:4443262-Pyramimonas_sp.AAC.1